MSERVGILALGVIVSLTFGAAQASSAAEPQPKGNEIRTIGPAVPPDPTLIEQKLREGREAEARIARTRAAQERLQREAASRETQGAPRADEPATNAPARGLTAAEREALLAGVKPVAPGLEGPKGPDPGTFVPLTAGEKSPVRSRERRASEWSVSPALGAVPRPEWLPKAGPRAAGPLETALPPDPARARIDADAADRAKLEKARPNAPANARVAKPVPPAHPRYQPGAPTPEEQAKAARAGSPEGRQP